MKLQSDAYAALTDDRLDAHQLVICNECGAEAAIHEAELEDDLAYLPSCPECAKAFTFRSAGVALDTYAGDLGRWRGWILGTDTWHGFSA
jgi:hypothetical protein